MKIDTPSTGGEPAFGQFLNQKHELVHASIYEPHEAVFLPLRRRRLGVDGERVHAALGLVGEDEVDDAVAVDDVLAEDVSIKVFMP